MALLQGPQLGSSVSVGAIGGFNSTALPRWYFLKTTENLEMTTAEIRGDLDGLILADSVARWYSSVSTLRLSQILDMYYSSRGVFNSTMRACNRRNLFTTVAPNSTMADQVRRRRKSYSVRIINEIIFPGIQRCSSSIRGGRKGSYRRNFDQHLRYRSY